MATTTELKGNFNNVKERVREGWSVISESVFPRIYRNTDQLIGMIEQETGTARREIEELPDVAPKNGASIDVILAKRLKFLISKLERRRAF